MNRTRSTQKWDPIATSKPRLSHRKIIGSTWIEASGTTINGLSGACRNANHSVPSIVAARIAAPARAYRRNAQ